MAQLVNGSQRVAAVGASHEILALQFGADARHRIRAEVGQSTVPRPRPAALLGARRRRHAHDRMQRYQCRSGAEA